MNDFRATGRMDVPEQGWHRARTLFHGFRLDDAGTTAEIRRLHAQGYLADPHNRHRDRRRPRAIHARTLPMIVAATAHPAKFPDAMETATGARPPLPPHMATLYEREERFTRAPNDLDAIEAQVRAFTLRNAA